MKNLTPTRRRPASLERVSTRLQSISDRNRRFAALCGVHTAPAVRFILTVDQPGEIYENGEPVYFPRGIEEAPPETQSAPDYGTPAPLDLIDFQGERPAFRDFVHELRAERETLRAQLETLSRVCNPSIYGQGDNLDTASLEARLEELDEMLIFEDEPTIRPGSGIVFRGSAACLSGSLFGQLESNQSGEFERMRAGRGFNYSAVLPFWGPLPSGQFYRVCDGHRKQVACLVLETVTGCEATAKRFFRQFAATFLSALPVDATFTGAQVWNWIDARQEAK